MHTSAWLANDGAWAQFLLNYADVEKTCSIMLDGAGYVLHDKDSYKPLKSGLNVITVPAFSALMIEKA